MKIETGTDSPHLLICRLSHIGDCVLTMPLASAIKQKWPKSTITWAVQKPSQQLLELNPDVDQVITVPKNWFKSFRAIKSLRKELRNCHPDIALDPQSLFKSASLARLAGAKHRIGFGGEYGREFSTWLNNCRVVPTSTHLVDRTLELLKPLGINHPQIQFKMRCSPFAKVYVNTAIEKSKVTGPYCIINPGASWPSKQWELDRFAVVANQLKRSLQIQSVIAWAGDEERRFAEQIVALSKHCAVMAPATNLEQYAALCEQARFFIGCDTGPMHIAAGMNTPCVVLHGPTLPEKSGAYGSSHVAIQKWYQDGGARQRRRANNDAMRDIQVEDVLDACDQIIARARSKAG